MKSFKQLKFWVIATIVLALGYVASCTKANQVLDLPKPTPTTNNSTTLVSKKVTTGPIIDGTIDAIWNDITKIEITPTVPDWSKGEIQNMMNNGHASFLALGRYKYSSKSAVIIGYDQPITSHPTNNPRPNICIGMETCRSSHAFQVFAGNYYGIVPQSNNMFNQNDYHKIGQFLIGFNITRLFNF